VIIDGIGVPHPFTGSMYEDRLGWFDDYVCTISGVCDTSTVFPGMGRWKLRLAAI
jgi:hypothetical protein